MAIPDTHTAIFTRIPESLEKHWVAATKGCADGTTTEESKTKHSISLISGISIIVKFNHELQHESSDLDEHDDSHNGRIEIWQTVRKNWSAIEDAISEIVQELNEKQISEAMENEMRTVEVLSKIRTIPSYATSAPLKSAFRDARGPRSDNSYQVRTLLPRESIHPSESASSVNKGQMRELLETIMEERGDFKTPTRSKKSAFETVRRRRTS